MSPKSSAPQAASLVSQVLMSDRPLGGNYEPEPVRNPTGCAVLRRKSTRVFSSVVHFRGVSGLERMLATISPGERDQSRDKAGGPCLHVKPKLLFHWVPATQSPNHSQWGSSRTIRGLMETENWVSDSNVPSLEIAATAASDAPRWTRNTPTPRRGRGARINHSIGGKRGVQAVTMKKSDNVKSSLNSALMRIPPLIPGVLLCYCEFWPAMRANVLCWVMIFPSIATWMSRS